MGAEIGTYTKDLLLSHTLQLIFIMVVECRASSRVWFCSGRDFDVLVGLDGSVVAHLEARARSIPHDGYLYGCQGT